MKIPIKSSLASGQFFLSCFCVIWQFNDPDPEVWSVSMPPAVIFLLAWSSVDFPKRHHHFVVILCVLERSHFFPRRSGDWVFPQEWAQKDAEP